MQNNPFIILTSYINTDQLMFGLFLNRFVHTSFQLKRVKDDLNDLAMNLAPCKRSLLKDTLNAPKTHKVHPPLLRVKTPQEAGVKNEFQHVFLIVDVN